MLLAGFGLEELQERRSDARRSVLWSSVLFAGLGLAGALLLGSVIARPLLQITQAARRVALGQDPNAAALPLGRRDEIGVLAGAFAHMLEQLEQQRGQIGRINADLAERVQQRTQELARTNAALAELERTQEQLVMADRRVSVGRLAAGVAHEVNNPMASLAGNLEYAATEMEALHSAVVSLGAPEAVAESVREVSAALADCRRGASRVVHIVRSLKTFARDDEDLREVLPLDRPVEAAIDMAMHELKHRARLVRRYGTVPHVEANEVRLSQVFLNLLINAAQAIPDRDADRHEIRITLDTDAEGRALAEVSDTGRGMTPEVMERIFDPFFTTKAVGVGSGLGLSISRNIVHKLGGEIAVESQPGQGTTFRITLPASSPPAEHFPEARQPAPDLAGLRLLVVDDDSDVAGAIRRLLSGDVTVVTARGGREALDHLASGERYDAILCDLMMPEVSGPEFHAELARRWPEALGKTVFMTGGVFTEGAHAFVERWRGPVLDKPLDADLLRRTLHALRT
jgi:signal transduction histidine kinase